MAGSPGYCGAPMTTAHITPLLEPLLFAPAFLVVGWALLSSWRGTPRPKEKHHD